MHGGKRLESSRAFLIAWQRGVIVDGREDWHRVAQLIEVDAEVVVADTVEVRFADDAFGQKRRAVDGTCHLVAGVLVAWYVEYAEGIVVNVIAVGLLVRLGDESLCGNALVGCQSVAPGRVNAELFGERPGHVGDGLGVAVDVTCGRRLGQLGECGELGAWCPDRVPEVVFQVLRPARHHGHLVHLPHDVVALVLVIGCLEGNDGLVLVRLARALRLAGAQGDARGIERACGKLAAGVASGAEELLVVVEHALDEGRLAGVQSDDTTAGLHVHEAGIKCVEHDAPFCAGAVLRPLCFKYETD